MQRYCFFLNCKNEIIESRTKNKNNYWQKVQIRTIYMQNKTMEICKKIVFLQNSIYRYC